MTQKTKLSKAFKQGRALSARQISAQFRIASPRKIISLIRMEEGLAIHSRKHVDSKGRVTHKYRLTTPSRDVVAAGYRAMAMGLV